MSQRGMEVNEQLENSESEAPLQVRCMDHICDQTICERELN